MPRNVPSKKQLIDELLNIGTKITPENVIDIRKLPDGRTVWLETGSDAAGLQHIYKRHEIEHGKVVGKNGAANVYRIIHNGAEHHIAVGVGSNEFVVRANPVSTWKPLL